jgi:hypothetical protein
MAGRFCGGCRTQCPRRGFASIAKQKTFETRRKDGGREEAEEAKLLPQGVVRIEN